MNSAAPASLRADVSVARPLAATVRGRLLPFAGAGAAGWLIGTYPIRVAVRDSCADFGQRGCTGDDFGPSLIGLAGLLLLLALIAGAVAATAGRRPIPTFAATLVLAGTIAVLAAFTEPASNAGWYIPTATTVALAVLLLAIAAFGAGERGPAPMARATDTPESADPPATAGSADPGPRPDGPSPT
ncbi:hypothetical protein [Embleya sp. AB8]|uniref:hypothetical protein n=1 Tax=Embleya sp. AB8 TaxID=3156304 RepID=UPI003C71F73A